LAGVPESEFEAALAVDLEPFFADEAKKRQLATLKRGDKLPDVENVPQREGRSRDQAAAAVGVSGKTVSQAKAIKAASPEMFEQVNLGSPGGGATCARRGPTRSRQTIGAQGASRSGRVTGAGLRA
jgi:hypothetical protein